jgi:hypothetical protein
VASQAAQVELAWNDLNNSAPDVGGYNLYYWQTDWNAPASVDVEKQTTYTLTGLEAGKTYYFAVTAYDQNGGRESAYSNVVSKTISGSSPPPATTPLVAAYGFDEGSGTGVTDTSRNANRGTISGATWTQGRFGEALAFDGINDYVAIPDSTSLDITGELTLEAWIYPRVLSGYRVIIDKTTTGAPSNYYLATLGDEVNFGFYSGSVWHAHTTNNANLALNRWYHVAAVYNDAQNTVEIYLDGARVLSAAETGSLVTNNETLRIGVGYQGEEFNGSIDEVRIYNQALSASEIRDDMNTPVASPAPSSGGSNTPITIEAESMTLTGYRVESNDDASGGRLISRRYAAAAPPGRAIATFSGAAGTYDVVVAYFDENDGRSQLAFAVNGVVRETWRAEEDLPSAGASAVTLTHRVVEGVALAPGDVLRLEGTENEGEYARVDKIELIP